MSGTRELRLVVTAADYAAAVRFYRDVLGLREEASFTDDNGGRATLLHAGRATIEIGDDAHAEAIDALEVGRRVAGPVRLAFEVGDAADAAQRLVAAGARLVAPATRTPWGSLNARLDGPDGQQLTVYSNDIYVGEQTPTLDGPVQLADPDPAWADTGSQLVRDIRAALGETALVVAHVGSTSVPGLPAKPVIDLILGVPAPADEQTYVPALEPLGYRLHLREPEWHEHRLLKHDDPAVNLHVFAAGSTELDRMLAFRDHLRRDAADRERYLRTKLELASRTWARVQDYADAKSDVVEEILRRAMSPDPLPLRGCFVVVTGPDGDAEAAARALAPRLGLPLLAEATVARGLGAAEAPAVLLAVAADSGGAVLHGSSLQGRTAELEALPGRVLHVRHDAAPDTEQLARLVRQRAATS